jgi:hypothetical protein
MNLLYIRVTAGSTPFFLVIQYFDFTENLRSCVSFGLFIVVCKRYGSIHLQSLLLECTQQLYDKTENKLKLQMFLLIHLIFL